MPWKLEATTSDEQVHRTGESFCPIYLSHNNSEHVLTDQQCPRHSVERLLLNMGSRSLEADESNSLPPLPNHLPSISVGFHYVLSSVLSTQFLIFLLLCAIIKDIPTMARTIWSWLHFKDPNLRRPFYEEERARKHLKRGKLKCDIGYYAQLVGLECDEFKIETEDEFILTVYRIVDRRPGAIDLKSNAFVRTTH